MEKQQVRTMLSIEKSYFSKLPVKSHSKRRFIADCLNKLTDDEHISEDVFALTMNIFDRFLSKTSSPVTDERSCQLIALCCYNISKKLRTNVLLNKENEQLSQIFAEENCSDDEIFNTEEMICRTLEWDLANVVPHDYIPYFLPFEHQAQIRLHVRILLSIAICELNTMTILPSLLACACIRAAFNGLSSKNIHQLDAFIFRTIDCQKLELLQTQCLMEQLFQSCLQSLTPSPRRRCLAPIDASPQQQRTKVK